MKARGDELVFLPLGGVGEIGMNLGLYGYGTSNDRTWLAVDFGVAFAGADLPGADLIFPDISYLEEERSNLAGIVITHAHEDHFGALIDLWPRLRVPVYATAFTAGLLMAKLASEPGAQPVPITVVAPGKAFDVGPFQVEFINVAHSIPEPNALAIRTALGLIVHSGDWKIDEAPVLGEPIDAARMQALGSEGVLALVSDSTNAMREGKSPSEVEVAESLVGIVAGAKGRVAFTTFASNVGRIRSMAKAAAAAGREVIVVGRALTRALTVAGELGYLEGLPPFRDEETFGYLPRDRVVVLLTGSQGEPRAALARTAEDEHKTISFDRGDTVIFSSRAIPGNEVAINRIINALTLQGVRVITDRDALVHVSGHPRRDEMRTLYGWLKPRIAVPVHGEAAHLAAHAELARSLGVPTVKVIENGTMLRLAPDPVEPVDSIEANRLYKDGMLVGTLDAVGITERRRLSFAGHVAVALVLNGRGDIEAEPEIQLTGIPQKDRADRPLDETVVSAVRGTLDSLPRPKRRDPEVVRDAVRRAVRAAIAEEWGKKPVCTVLVSVV